MDNFISYSMHCCTVMEWLNVPRIYTPLEQAYHFRFNFNYARELRKEKVDLVVVVVVVLVVVLVG